MLYGLSSDSVVNGQRALIVDCSLRVAGGPPVPGARVNDCVREIVAVSSFMILLKLLWWSSFK